MPYKRGEHVLGKYVQKPITYQTSTWQNIPVSLCLLSSPQTRKVLFIPFCLSRSLLSAIISFDP